MSKVLNFGTFGKWSIDTLNAQTTVNRWGGYHLPDSVEKKKSDIKSNINDYYQTKVKKMTIGEIQYNLNRINNLEKDLEKYGEMRTLVINLRTKKKVKK